MCLQVKAQDIVGSMKADKQNLRMEELDLLFQTPSFGVTAWSTFLSTDDAATLTMHHQQCVPSVVYSEQYDVQLEFTSTTE